MNTLTLADLGDYEPTCLSAHMGLWLFEPARMNRAIEAIKSGRSIPDGRARAQDDADKPFRVDSRNIARVAIRGSMTKDGKFGTSTVRVRQQLRAAAGDPEVRGILMVIDSGGGTVDGTADLADDVARAASVKPVHVFAEDLMASAALWVGSQASRISANRTAEVGSIGVVAVVQDLSKMADQEGIVVHVVVSEIDGEPIPFKGAFTPGTEVTDDQLAMLQSRVNDLSEIFFDAVARGRGRDMEWLHALATGEVFIASKALQSGLIDAVGSIDDALAALDEDAGRAESETIEARMRRRRRAMGLV